ncbi:TPA: LOG family protein [bacterium]|jgi:hypothetical protein|nr:LOG family protein [bacterium]
METGKVVTIFGSSGARPDGNTYKQAFQLGELLAQSGFVVCNGGYAGVMDASAHGAKLAGGKTIGITTEAFNSKPVSTWLDERIKTDDYIQRLDKLIKTADAFIILKGGLGTLSELSLVWCLTVIGEIHKPIILVGDYWKKAIDKMQKCLLIDNSARQALTIVDTPKGAVEILRRLMI